MLNVFWIQTTAQFIDLFTPKGSVKRLRNAYLQHTCLQTTASVVSAPWQAVSMIWCNFIGFPFEILMEHLTLCNHVLHVCTDDTSCCKHPVKLPGYSMYSLMNKEMIKKGNQTRSL